MSETLPPIRESIVIEADVEKVWRIMTSEASVPRWLGCMRYKSEIGAVFYMQQDQAKAAADDVTGAVRCEILVLEQPAHFRFSWFVEGFPATYVSLRLVALAPAQTRVDFEHEGWDQYPPDAVRAIYEMLSGGWKSFVLPGLKRVAEAD